VPRQRLRRVSKGQLETGDVLEYRNLSSTTPDSCGQLTIRHPRPKSHRLYRNWPPPSRPVFHQRGHGLQRAHAGAQMRQLRGVAAICFELHLGSNDPGADRGPSPYRGAYRALRSAINRLKRKDCLAACKKAPRPRSSARGGAHKGFRRRMTGTADRDSANNRTASKAPYPAIISLQSRSQTKPAQCLLHRHRAHFSRAVDIKQLDHRQLRHARSIATGAAAPVRPRGHSDSHAKSSHEKAIEPLP